MSDADQATTGRDGDGQNPDAEGTSGEVQPEPTQTDHPAGEGQASRNAENEPPS